jgi:hypothetical protein
MAARLSAPLYSPEISYYYSANGTHFSQRLSIAQGIVLPEGLAILKEKSFPTSGLKPATIRLVA